MAEEDEKMSVNVGDVLWHVPQYGAGHEIEITKVGRKWAYFQYGRFDINTGYVDGAGYSSSGRVYLSKKQADDEDRRYRLWAAFKVEVYHLPRAKASETSIREAAALLGIELRVS